MSTKTKESPSRPEASRRRETGYFHGHGEEHARGLAQRTAGGGPARFLLPHLEDGMRVLDCGCGPGSITVGLAQAVGSGEAVGVDISPRFVATATDLAAERGVENVSFRQGDAYDLPFDDGSFDVVFAHTLLVHLGDPLAAVKEMVRVARPGGLVALRDNDWASRIWAPLNPLLEKFSELSVQALEHLGASPCYARHQRELLLQAGCEKAEAAATATCAGSPETLGRIVPRLIQQVRQPGFAKVALAEGWLREGEVDDIEQAVRAWGERPDAFFAVLSCEAIGWAAA